MVYVVDETITVGASVAWAEKIISSGLPPSAVEAEATDGADACETLLACLPQTKPTTTIRMTQTTTHENGNE
jgi:hypothetical protein